MRKEFFKRLAEISDLTAVCMLMKDGKNQMAQAGILQWDQNYPSPQIIAADIKEQKLWLYNETAACATLDFQKNILFIRRLVVGSLHQSSGLGGKILDDSIRIAKQTGNIESIHLVTNHSNRKMQHLLQRKEFRSIRRFQIADREQYGDFIEFSRKI